MEKKPGQQSTVELMGVLTRVKLHHRENSGVLPEVVLHIAATAVNRLKERGVNYEDIRVYLGNIPRQHREDIQGV